MALDIRGRLGRTVFRGARFMAQLGFSLAGSGVVPDYEGASTGRRLQWWGLSSSGPNTAIMGSLKSIVSRSRELLRNNPWAKSGKGTLVAEWIGTGIVPSWHIPSDPALAEELQVRWFRWCKESDADGSTDFHGQQAGAADAVVESGEVLARFRERRASDGLSVPLQIQLLEPDHLDETYEGILPSGNFARMGVEFDKYLANKRIAYWLRRSHPGDLTPMSIAGGTETIRVPAREILHIRPPGRPGQVRSLPLLSALILRLHELDEYDDAQLLRQKIASLLVGFYWDDGDPKGTLGINEGVNAKGMQQIQLEPGLLQRLKMTGAGKLEWSKPPDPGANFPEYMKYQLRAISAGLMLTYEQLSGDYSDSNLSAQRLALQRFRRWAEMLQWSVFVFQFCQPVAERWLDVGVATGSLPISPKAYIADRSLFTDIQWSPPKWPYIDPVKDVTADIMEVRAGFAAKSEKIADRGGTAATVERKMAEDNARADKLGLVLDSDPRRVSQSGTAQTEAVTAAALSEPSDGKPL